MNSSYLISNCFFGLCQLDGATYHISKFKSSGGGVGRNIAEGLSKLYGHVEFISKIGNDKVNIKIKIHFIITIICIGPFLFERFVLLR